MSFGFSVGDFITAIEFANKIRKEFFNAPSQFKAISDEVRNLSIVLQDADVAFPSRELNTEQKKDLEYIDKGCRNVLNELQQILDNNSELSSESVGVGRRIKRVWKRLNWKPDDIEELRDRISTNIGFLNAFNGRLTRDNVLKLVRYQEDQGCQTVLNWITPVDYAAQQNDFISRRQAGTGQWLLESSEFQAWLATDQQVLFCPGIPGVGKTILTSIVVDYLYTKFKKDADIGIAYLYCNFRRQNEQNAEGLLASLLKQLAQGLSSLPKSVKSLYDIHRDQRTRPTFNEISATLQSVGALYSRIFIIVDALDECQLNNGCRTKFLKEIFALQAKCRANFFTTSRFIPEINENFKDSMQLEIRASNHDIQRYLDGHISELSRCVLHSLEIQNEIKAEIIKAVDGMFLLAQLYFDSLKGKTSLKTIRTALKKLITGSEAYDHAYNAAMERIKGQLADGERLAIQVLSWITCAKRPLTTSEIKHAIAVELEESKFDEENLSPIEDIISVCAGLVTVDKESSIIRLVHYTTQEYFERTQERWFPDAEIKIASICVTYLSFHIFESGVCPNDKEFEERLRLNPFYNYASQNWGHHARKASTLIPEVISFLQMQTQVEASTQVLLTKKIYLSHQGFSQVFPQQMTGLHLAAYFGIEAAIESLPEIGLAVFLKDSYGRTALSWAAENGHEAVVKLLLGKGAEVDSKDSYGQTPLSCAAGLGHEAAVKLLLEESAEVDSKDTSGQTPLLWAAENGHEAVVKLLLEKGAEVDSKDTSGQTPLSWAARRGHEAVVKLLLEDGAKLDSKDTSGQTALSWAVENGHEAVVKLLLEKGAEVDSKDTSGQTPLSWAARRGREAVVKLLLGEGAEVDSKDTKHGQTPLSWAAENGYEAVVKLLLEKHAEVDSKDTSGKTPLSWAAGLGREAVVKLLLEKGAEVDSKDTSGQTPLSWVAGLGREAVVKLLLEEGAEVDSKDTSGRTPLSWAAENGYEAVVKLLLEKGAELDSKDTSGQTALSWAARWGHEAVVKLLLEEGAEVDSKDTTGQTLLSCAARWGHEAVARLLLEKGAEVDSKDTSGQTPLSWAAENGHEAVVKLLLEKGAELDSKDTSGQTPLSWAIVKAQEAVEQLLLRRGAILVEDIYGLVALFTPGK